jgi:hypothetical protein
MLEARVGFEPVSPIDAMQLIHSATRQKRRNGQISRMELHAGYTVVPEVSRSLYRKELHVACTK